MKKLKYVMNLNSDHYAILPNNGMAHSSVAFVEPWTSAGFLSFSQEGGVVKVNCWGRSDSLNLDSDPRDAEVIMRTMNEFQW